MASTEHRTPPTTFPDRTRDALLYTSSGRRHDLLAGWELVAPGREDAPNAVRGVTRFGYFVSVRWDHVESIEQRDPLKLAGDSRLIADTPSL